MNTHSMDRLVVDIRAALQTRPRWMNEYAATKLGALLNRALERIEQLQMPHAEVMKLAELDEGADIQAMLKALCAKVQAQRRELSILNGKMEVAVRRAEEQGYARGLEDMRKYPGEISAPAASQQPEGEYPDARQWEAFCNNDDGDGSIGIRIIGGFAGADAAFEYAGRLAAHLNERPAASQENEALVDELQKAAGECALREYAPSWEHTDESAAAALQSARSAVLERMRAEASQWQERVAQWMAACFTPAITADRGERNHRFLEESLELVQSLGCTASEAHQLVDYVFGRPVGEPSQELGGVMVTIAALANASAMMIDIAADAELARCWTKIDVIRAKQAGKPKHSPLPAPPAGDTRE